MDGHDPGQEFPAASAALAARVPIGDALRAANGRLDARLQAVFSRAPLAPACRKGCSICCRHLCVSARPYEVFAIAEYIGRRMDDDRQRDIAAAVSRQAAKRRAQTAAERQRTNEPCALLLDGACSVYPVRPGRCRMYHSTGLEACQAAFDRPGDPDRPIHVIAEAIDVAADSIDGFAAAVAGAGHDSAAYELSTALEEALEGPVPLKRFRKGKRAFLRAIVDTPEPEVG